LVNSTYEDKKSPPQNHLHLVRNQVIIDEALETFI